METTGTVVQERNKVVDISWDGFCRHCGKNCHGKCGKSQEMKVKQVMESDVVEYLQGKLKELEGTVNTMMALKDVVSVLVDKVRELEGRIEDWELKRSEAYKIME